MPSPNPRNQMIAKEQYMRNLMDSKVFGLLSKAERGVLLSYARHMNGEWVAWPGPTRLAGQAGVSIARAKIARSVLMKLGFLADAGPQPGTRIRRYKVLETGWENVTAEQRRAVATPPSRRKESGSGGALARHQVARLRNARWRASAPQKVSHENTLSNVEAKFGVSPPPPAPPEATLYDDDDAVQLLIETGEWDNTPPRRADATRLVKECGPHAVRQGLTHAKYLQRVGKIKSTFRACIVHACRGYHMGTWAPDERMIAEETQAKNLELAKRRESDKLRRSRKAADELAAEQEADQLLWAQLSPEVRDRYFAAVLAKLDPSSQRFLRKRGADSFAARPLIIKFARETGAA